MITVQKITNEQDLQTVFSIREKVFVEEQQVNREDEYDQYEQSAVHFMAIYDGQPCGTARWRFTDKGIKLERFAVLKEFRGKKVGDAVLKAVLEDISQNQEAKGKMLYLHAQVQVTDFYAKQGFESIGEMFEECDIQHYKMQRKGYE